MDTSGFDAIARAFAAAVNRRAGLRAAAAVAAGMAAVGGAATGASGRKTPKPAVSPEGRPCGPKAKANLCENDGDCCTKFCKKGKRGKPGRCRCIKPGERCKNGQTCCGGATCVKRKCTVRCTDCEIVCTVCASGCAFNTVEAAYAAAAPGAVITIDNGTYPTEIFVTKDVTLKACRSDPNVLLVPRRATMLPPTDSYYVVIAEDQVDTATPRAVTLDGLRLAGNAGHDDEALIFSFQHGTVSWTVRNCALSGADIGFSATGGVHVLENSTFDGFRSPAYFYQNIEPFSVTATGCTFSNNTNAGIVSEGGVTTVTACEFTGNDDGGIAVYDGAMTVIDSRVTGNSSVNNGGGIYATAGFFVDRNGSLTLGGTTVVTGNTALEGSGIAVRNTSPYAVTVTGASSANVYGNLVGDQCERTADGTTWTPVANCAL